MNKQYLITFALVASASLWSCSGSEKSPESGGSAVAEDAPCVYTFVPDSTRLTWTAYKTTEKVGVSGTFTLVNITGTAPAALPIDVFKTAAFNIPTDSVFTNNPERDIKILKFFFGNFSEGNLIEGRVKSVESATYGKGTMLLKMNGIEKEVPFTFEGGDTEVNLASAINLNDWHAGPAVDSLNNVCYDLHKGPDGLSKLWPDVKLELRTVLVKACQ